MSLQVCVSVCAIFFFFFSRCFAGRNAHPSERAAVPRHGWDFLTHERHFVGAGGRDLQPVGLLPPSDSQVGYPRKGAREEWTLSVCIVPTVVYSY